MSDINNDYLIDEAWEWADVYVSTTMGNMLEQALKENDLDMVRELVRQCRKMDSENE